jgi:hypothetical protein
MRPKPLLCAAIIIAAITFLLVPTTARATNIVRNASFEEGGIAHWNFDGSVDIRIGQNCPDGTNYLIVLNTLWQDVPTTSNETYYVRFWSGQYAPALYFAGQQVMLTSNKVVWHLYEGYATATGSVTRLEFTGNGNVDGVQVISTLEPVQIIAQPASSAILEGGSATFSVLAAGGRPFTYQWLFNDAPIPQATNALLYLTNLQSTNAGIYSVLVSSTNSFAVSTGAVLTVEPPPKTPIIVAQPTGGTVNEGYAYYLSVVAIGEAPFSYQWFLNGASMMDATNYALTFASVQSSNTGVYSVRVQNSHGSVSSLPASLAVTNPMRIGGLVTSGNNSPMRPIFDVDGVTKLSGPGFLAQLYAGPSPTSLRPVGPARPFGTTTFTRGLFMPTININIPDVAPGEAVYFQTRVWETNLGNFYEDVRIRGGKYNVSAVYSGVIPPELNYIPIKVPIESFSLRAGTPFLTTGKIEVNARHPGGLIEWKLTGAAGFTYLIEKQTPPHDWAPLLIITNTTGTVLFTDTNAGPASANFYRSRMLD